MPSPDTNGGDLVDTNLVPLSGCDDVSTSNYTLAMSSRTASPTSLLPLVHDDLSLHVVVHIVGMEMFNL